jgi:Reverse transcriptase (RNA-dependent DNA polymerase)
MGHKKKPNLCSIQELGAAAYVKDLNAGKLDSQAKKGHFVGYDSESKGYRIYWPEKRSITVEHNVVFNQDDANTSDKLAVINSVAQSEGENKKIIQALQNNNKSLEDPENKKPADQHHQEDNSQTHQSPKLSNSVPFPSTDNPQPELEPNKNDQALEQQYRRCQRVKHQKGNYKALNKGLVAAATVLVDETQTDDIVESPKQVVEHVDKDVDGYYDNSHQLPPDIALASFAYLDPKTLDKALRRLDAKHWQDALEYKISQLKKLGTWEVVDLPVSHTAIPCSEVVRVKQGLDREVQSYRVKIVAGGHKQIEGVNYTETFLAAAKMPTVCVVLTNAAHQDWEIEHVDIKSAYLNAPLNEEIYIIP